MRKNKIYNYNELKNLINEELINFIFIVESKHIFNSEFKFYKRFFKGLTKKTTYIKDTEYNQELQKYVPIKRAVNPFFDTYVDSKCSGTYFTLTNENVIDLDMNQLHKDFPHLKANYDLLLSLKPNVRSGRRPKDLEKDYEAERLKKAQEEDKATCGICHNYWELVDMGGEGRKFNLSKNVIADHGFTIRDGFGRNGVCFGARFESWEKSSKVKIEYVKQVLKPTLDKVSKEKPSEATVTALTKWIARFKVELEDYYKLSFNERRDTEKPNRPEYLLTGQRVGLLISTVKPITLNELVQYWNSYKLSLQEEINRFELQIKNWTLQPTPREQLTIKGDK